MLLDTLHTKLELELPKSFLVKLLRKLYRHITLFLKEYDISINELETYKVLSWYSFILSEELTNLNDEKAKVLGESKWAVLIACEMMNYCLLEQTNKKHSLPRTYLAKLYLMSLNDKIKDDLAIGRNGLYMAFKSSMIIIDKKA